MKVAVSWSGGMESNLALYKTQKEGHDIKYLVAFVTETWPSFCHPVTIMELQSKSLGIPLIKLIVKQPYDQGYRDAIKKLVDMGMEGIVTGDIYVVDDYHGPWMEKATRGQNIELIMPLWEQDTTKVLDEEISSGFKSVFTCLIKKCFTEEWLGRELNKTSVSELKALAKETNMDPCGENGEYHTMVINGPNYKQPIEITKITKEQTDTRLYLKINKYALKPSK